MKFIIDYGQARMVYRNLETVPEDLGKLFRFMLYAQAKEMAVGKTVYFIK